MEPPPRPSRRRTLDPDTQAVVAFAIEQLTAYDNPNAHLMAATLQTLRGYRPEDTIRAHARRAITAAEAYLGRHANAASARPSKGPATTRVEQIRSGIDAMKRLAQ